MTSLLEIGSTISTGEPVSHGTLLAEFPTSIGRLGVSTGDWIVIEALVFIVVMILSGIIIPQILLIAFRKKLFDEIDPRKIHQGAVPRLGGIAFFPSILFAMLLVFGIISWAGVLPVTDGILMNLRGMCFITCAVIILYLVGMADDLVGVKYRAKFGAQIIAGLLVCAGGLLLDNLHGFLWIDRLPLWVSVILTVLLTVFITNAINLIDGIDGLASGLSGIACIFYGVMLMTAGLPVYAMLAFGTLGALVPFFWFNVFGNPARHRKIFMGDTGALTVGLILSVLSIRLCRVEYPVDGANPAVLAFAPLLIPCLDVVRVYLGRIRAHRNPFLPDKTHIHHKLLSLGMNQRVAMPMIVGASCALILINYLLSAIINITLLFGLDLFAWTSANMWLSRSLRLK